MQMASKVYRGLSEVLGLRDESMVLSVFVRKIITNLKYWSHRDPIVVKTLLLLNELCVGYSSVRKLVKLEEVQFILQNHTVNFLNTLHICYTYFVYSIFMHVHEYICIVGLNIV